MATGNYFDSTRTITIKFQIEAVYVIQCFGCSINWLNWNVTIIFRFFQRCLKWQPKRCFNDDGKHVLRLLNVVIHEHQFKRNGKYCKFHFDKEAYTKPKTSDLYVLNWKSAYDVMLFMCQVVNNILRNFNFCDF